MQVDRRTAAVLEAAAATSGLSDLLTTALAALDEHVGVQSSAFMLTLRGSGRAYAGVKHGSPEHVMEEYFEQWADRDPLATPAAQTSFRQQGRASTAELYRQLDGPRRLFVDDFLRRTRSRHQLSFALPCASTTGYLTVMGDAELDGATEATLNSLVEPLAELLRTRLPRGLDGPLSSREAQVCELVALGFTNREIGSVLHVEEDTVKKHVSHALSKLRQRHRSELAVAWATGSLIDVPFRGRDA
jgi:DNA-binding CsgD family transcriptional regulator